LPRLFAQQTLHPSIHRQPSRKIHQFGDINDPNFYSQLRVRLEEMEKNGSSPNHLFYVSTPASVAGPSLKVWER
jgi:hypothetical protein